MKRTIVNIDEKKCTGCGLCIPNCHEGALQIIDDKVRLISDLFCDGLGACLGHCPEGAITLEEREAEPYNETKVMELMVKKGRNTVLAHLSHLKKHNENKLLNEAIVYIKSNNIDMSTNFGNSPMTKAETIQNFGEKTGCSGGCPGSMAMDFRKDMEKIEDAGKNAPTPSELRQWPVQLHLLNPQASYFKNADVVLAADCT
ncbi:MAG: 4Fe-4S binding protein, partial [Lentimicrobiaceae bacterium]|nr:4Fe-4S binding protein [Lentimicrobiaceae bacterium]